MAMRQVLVVDDLEETNRLIGRQVGSEYQVFHATSPEDAQRRLVENNISLLIIACDVSCHAELELLAKLRELQPNLVTIVISSYPHMDSLISAMNRGLVYRFVLTPWRAEDLLVVLAQASKRLSSLEAGTSVNRAVSPRIKVASQVQTDLVVESRRMKSVMQRASKVASTAVTVLLQGESGTGKEVLARYIHDHSPRAGQPFVAVNCGALSESLLENELFGHERGAFTGADSRKSGKFEVAEGGTLFLDEIGDISPRLQVILLRVLEARCFERVGGTETVHADVRIIAASLKPLAELVENQSFRSDLFYRLNVFPIGLPALRERPEDTKALVRRFLRPNGIARAGMKVSEDAMRALCKYTWPGNVRELRNVVDRMKILADGDVIDASLVEASLLGAPSVSTPPPSPLFRDDDNWEQRIESRQRMRLKDALIDCEGNRSQAARSLGMKRTTFLYHCRKSGLI